MKARKRTATLPSTRVASPTQSLVNASLAGLFSVSSASPPLNVSPKAAKCNPAMTTIVANRPGMAGQSQLFGGRPARFCYVSEFLLRIFKDLHLINLQLPSKVPESFSYLPRLATMDYPTRF